MNETTLTESKGDRVPAIDVFRGFAIVAMVAVNFLAGVAAVPAWLKHAPDAGLTFTDLVAPFFILAIGLTFRLSFEKRVVRDGRKAAYEHFIKRYLALMALGFIMRLGEMWVGVAKNDFNWGVLQAIGLAGLIALVFLRFPWWGKLIAGLAGLAAYQILTSLFLGDAILHMPHGGAAGAFSWAGFLILGCAAADVFHRFQPKIRNLLVMAAGFSAAGLLIALLVPVSKNRVSASYVLLALGLSLLLFLGFFLLSEKLRVRVPLLPAWGKNPLLLYVLHLVLLGIWVLPGVDWWYAAAPLWLAFIELAAILAVLTLLAVFLAGRRFVVSL